MTLNIAESDGHLDEDDAGPTIEVRAFRHGELVHRELSESGEQTSPVVDVDGVLFVRPQDAVIVPPDDQTAARSALAAGESITDEGLVELLEGAPPAAEELVHVESSVQEVLLDEGEPFERPADDDVELAWTDASEQDGREE